METAKKQKRMKSTFSKSLGRSPLSSRRSLLLTTASAAFFKTDFLSFSFSASWNLFKKGERILL